MQVKSYPMEYSQGIMFGYFCNQLHVNVVNLGIGNFYVNNIGTRM